MEQSIGLITLGVSDIARARRFYVDGLGWTPVFENEQVVFFQMSGCVFGLFGRAALEEDMRRPCPGPGAFSIAHNVADRASVDEVMAIAERAGATILKPAEDVFWGGYSGYFADLDGHAWEVAWNPTWTIDGNGIVRAGV
jgi:catechol 2,3-dioxygenase-like lactoylglutathione lyase family enzyme